jgi:hypothetical protein
MTLREIPFRAGVWKDDTSQASRGFAIDSDKIRFVNGRAEALGGWSQQTVGLRGKARATLEFTTIAGVGLMAIATSAKLYLYLPNRLIDITPARAPETVLGANPIASTAGSDRFVLSHFVHGAQVGDTVWIRGAAPVGGVGLGGAAGTLGSSPYFATLGSRTIKVVHVGHGLVDNDIAHYSAATGFAGIPAGDFNGPALRVHVLNVNSYQIEVATAATATTSGGGTPNFGYAKPHVIVEILAGGNSYVVTGPGSASSTGSGGGAAVVVEYDVSVGRESTRLSGSGYGSGPYGRGPYGRSPTRPKDPVPLPLRQWSLADYGEALIANIVGGPIYWWRPNMSQRAELLPNSPAQCNAVIVTRERYLLACGCTNSDGNFDPMAIRHPDDADITLWLPAVTNNARGYRLGQGSAIIGVADRQTGPMIWTDTTPHVGRFAGTSDQIYAFDDIGSACGLVAPHAVVERDGAVYWLTPGLQFYSYRGGLPEPLPCRLATWFKKRLALLHTGKLYAFADTHFPAISFLFVSGSAIEPGEYVRLDVPEQRRNPDAGWSHGTMDRTVWSQGTAFPDKLPLAVSPNGILYRHEEGFGADGGGIARFIVFSPVSIEDGHQKAFISRVVMDVNMAAGTGQVMLQGREWPGKPLRQKGPLLVTPTQMRLDTRFACREVGYTLRTEDAEFWRLGVISGDVSPGPLR